MKRLPILLVVLATLIQNQGLASIAPPVEVTVKPLETEPVAGQTISVTFDIISEIAATVTDVRFRPTRNSNKGSRPDWEVSNHTAPPSFTLVPGKPTSIEVATMCNDPLQQIRIEFKFAGGWVRRDFYLLSQNVPAMADRMVLRTVPGTQDIPVRRISPHAVPEPEPAMKAEEPAGATAQGSTAVLLVNLDGTIVFYRSDGRSERGDGVTVRAYARSAPGYSDVLLGSQVTDSSGNFDFSVVTNSGANLYLEVVTSSAVGSVIYPSSGVVPYRFITPTLWNWTGSAKHFGSLFPDDLSLAPAFQLQTSLTRSWRMALGSGFLVPDVRVEWPSGDNASYSRANDIIYMSTAKQWEEFTLAHEYGHHFNDEFGAHIVSQYCNDGDFGDDGDDCGHLLWCPENIGVGWSEGIADWYGAEAVAEFQEEYGTTISEVDIESIVGCSDDGGNLQQAELTEGYVAALIMDIADGKGDRDDNALDNGQDSTNFGRDAIFEIVNDHKPFTAEMFFNAVVAEHPSSRTNIWRTGANNRFNWDFTDPPPVSTLYSTSHQVSGDSPDRSVDLWWNGVPDDTESGLKGFVVYAADNDIFANRREIVVNQAPTLDAWTTVDNCYPGQWWFMVFSVDNAGNLGGPGAEFGPVTIRQGTPADLEPSHGTWPYPVLAKNNTGPPFDITPFLFGNIEGTYFSLSVGNGGELEATGTQHHRLYVDGIHTKYFTTTDLAAFGQFSIVDSGPYLVRGGRHNLTFIADADEEKAELDEDNNWYSKQYIWSGMGLNGNWRTRDVAPDPWAGFKSTTIFSSPNCDGFSFTTQVDVFRGVVLVPDGMSGVYGDHDLRSFPISTGSENGFSSLSMHAESSRPAGCLDAVFTVNDLSDGTYFNVGAYHADELVFGFDIHRVDSVNINPQTVNPITILDGDYLNLYRVSIGGGNPGGDFATLRVNSDPADGLLHAAVFDMATAHAGLDDPLVAGQSNSNGEITLNFDQINGRHMVAVWQDPKDTPPGAGDLAATLWIGQRPPDLTSIKPAGWHAAVTPTDGAPGTVGSVPEPTQLQGNTASTYFNYAIRNDSPTTATLFSKMTYLDGDVVTGSNIGQMAGYTNHLSNYNVVQTVQGGRHSLSGVADHLSELTEASETNNAFGRQWVWSPYQLPGPGGWETRSAPPDPTGGWDHVLASPDPHSGNSPVYFNCDGLRTPMPGISGDDGWWQAVAILPLGGSTDYDLRLHKMDPSVDGGFKGFHEISNWAQAKTDFVMVNFRDTTPRQFDVGVVATNGSKDYRVHVAKSTFLGTNPAGTMGPFAMASDALVSLHEIYLDTGPVTIRTVNVTGTVDWGMSLHLANRPYHSKTGALEDQAMSWTMGGAGGTEEIFTNIQVEGYYCLAVWRDDRAESGAGTYNLEFDNVSAVEEDILPDRNALVGIHPNPFNPRTTVEFELAGQNDVAISIYDLRGAMVRELVRGVFPAGRHQETWTGLNDRGQQVPSGTYFVQLRVGGIQETRRASLVK